MYFFDVVESDVAEQPLARRLGFKKIFTAGKEVYLATSLREIGDIGKKYILLTSNPSYISKGVSTSNVIGIIMGDLRIRKKQIEDMAASGKFLVFAAWQFVLPEANERISKALAARALMKFAIHEDAPLSIISLARTAEELYSSAQLFELARFIGAPDALARSMISRLGELIYDNEKKK